MSRILDIVLNGSQDESADRAVLATDGSRFRLLQNCRLERDGRLAIRPQFTSLFTFTSGLTPQLATFKDRPVAALSSYYLKTYAPEFTAGSVTASPLPALSAVESVWQNPSGAAARQFDIAYTSGVFCIVQVDDSNVLTVTLVTTDGTQLSRQQVSPISSARVISNTTDEFVIVTRGTTGTMAARALDSLGGSLTAATTLEATVATGTTHWDLCTIPGSTDYLVTYPRPASGNVRLRRYDISHTLVATLDYTSVTSVGDSAIVADTATRYVWAIQDGNNIVMTRVSDSLALVNGPTTVQTVAGIRAPGLARRASASGAVWLTTTTATASSAFLLTSSSFGAVITSDASAPNVWGASKPLPLTTADGTNYAMVVGQVSAGSAFGLPFYSACAYDAILPGVVHGLWDFGVCSPLDVLSASDTGGRSSVATDGTYYYALTTYARGLELGGGVPGALRLVRLSFEAQRQCVEAGGLLHISGGQVSTFDGSVLSAQGFADVPRVISVAEDASGSQTALATYQYIAVYEFNDAAGNVVRSQPSAPFEFTLTGANDRAIPTVSTPRTLKNVSNGITARVILYRANPSDSVFFRVAESGDVSLLDVSATTTINDGVSDATAETREILYTQSQTPLPNAPAGSAKFIAVGRDRLIFGGLQDPNQIKLSKSFFPGEPPECAHPGNAAFTLRLPQPCTGVAASGDTYIAFTRESIYVVPGAGPQRNGQGEFFAPQTLYADGGCIDWRSIVSCGAGTFFQLESDKIYVLRPGGQVEWIGAAVQDTLASYPVIKGACLCSSTQQVVFACQAADGNSGVLLIHDTTTGGWYTDDINADTVAEYDGRLIYVAHGGAAVLHENAAAGAGSGSALTMSVRTGSFRPFGSQGQGEIHRVGLLGTYVGDSTVEAFISYDDGKTWTSLGSVSVTSANTALGNPVSGNALASGDPVSLQWIPTRAVVDRFALRFDVVESSDTGAMRLHTIALDVEPVQGMSRLPAGSIS